MINWNDIWVQQERYQDFLKEAETERLARLARMASPQYRGLRRQTLAWLGQQLVVWGQNLECQSGVPAPVINRQTAQSPC